MSAPPLTIEPDGLWAVLRNAAPYKAAIESVGGKWRADNTWRIPLLVSTMNGLQRAGVPLPDYNLPDSADPWLVEPRAWSGTRPMNFQKLYPYQQSAAEFLTKSPYPGTILALSCGLGKTPTAIVSAEMVGARSVLVLAPKVLIPVWRQERDKWAVFPWNDPKQDPLLPWVVTNWEFAIRNQDQFDIPWDVIIVDESVLIKNRATARYKFAKKLRKRAGRMWLLSGSPITRHVDDLWTQLSLCFPDAFRSYWKFVDAWCYSASNPWGGRDVTGSRNYNYPEEFKDLAFVRNQIQVLEDLPDFIEQSIPVALRGEQKVRYKQAQDDLIVSLEGEETVLTNRISQITRLAQLASHPGNLDSAYNGPVAKLDALMELVESGAVEKPILIWTYFRGTAQAIGAALTRAGHTTAVVVGGTPDAEATIRAYKDGAVDILILGLSVGRFGLSLQNTRSVVYVDRTFDADSFIQSMARVRRLGLTHKFHVITLFAPHTVDELIIDNIAGKLPAITKVSGSDLAEMLRAL